MRKHIAAWFLLIVSLSISAGNPKSGRAGALAELRRKSPEVSWEHVPSLKVDIDSDGQSDYVFLSQNPTSATVGVVLGKAHAIHVRSLPIGDPTQDSICAAPASIWAESLDYGPPVEEISGFTRSRTGTAFGLGGGECDAFHFFGIRRGTS